MSEALTILQEKLETLIEDAKRGAIIPIRLPGQLEEIAALLEGLPTESAAPPPELPPEMDAYREEQAEFVTVAVHDLRTPLTSIRGYSDMLHSGVMGELNDSQHQFLNTIRTNIHRMEGLLQDVSDLGKLRGGTIIISEKMDMAKNITGLVEKAMVPLAKELGKILTFDIPQGLPLLNTDGEYIAKAISKFVENGLRYSGEDGEVIVSAIGAGNRLTVTVRDNGIGMTPDELEKLGTLFWRAEREEVRVHKGSGLGVPIAYGLLDLLDASYTVESEHGTGTLVTIGLDGMG
jgi:cell cycle sensor histidine kinase DivJ